MELEPFQDGFKANCYFKTLNNFAFIRHLSPKTRAAWANVCKDTFQRASEFDMQTRNIEQYLSFYFQRGFKGTAKLSGLPVAVSFREALRTSKGVVVGSMATSYIDRAAYSNSMGMDVMTSWEGALVLEAWALGHEFSRIRDTQEDLVSHYTVGLMSSSYVWVPFAQNAVRYALHYSNISTGREMHILVVDGPIYEGVLQSPLTHMMNCFDHEMAYSAFPETTFEERRSILNRPAYFLDGEDAEKAKKQGWHVIYGVPELSARDVNSEWWEGTRSLSDGKTLRVRLEPTNGYRCSRLLAANSWEMRYHYRWGLRPRVMHDIVHATALPYKYLAFNREFADRARVAFSGQFVVTGDGLGSEYFTTVEEDFERFASNAVREMQAKEYLPA